MRIYILTILTFTLFISCKTDPNKQIDEGKITENKYHSKEIGWTMEIPKGWNVTHKSVLDERTEKGLDAINETAGIEYDASGLKQLLNFQKNKFNIFQSTSEPFELEYEGEWEENNAGLKELIYNTYLQRGMKTDSTETKTIEIDGLKFQSYEFTIYSPKGDVILNQIMYSRFINGLDFGVSINYNNESDKKEMLDVWLSSKFKK
ncbi:hypothetical protein [Olleya marilimosa]|uniref:Uncharacterized protein n=1 Tax=Olleya marilimosa TaxID=272164 RepID=A0ABR8LY69_9FLAO|nr:hypothetical protein [Olleya marilimosa]MBD3864671.1 hypothetical protein [Olleya marilimosa]MBD3892151.1 hypothetical protein [Olleya marilimosa]